LYHQQINVEASEACSKNAFGKIHHSVKVLSTVMSEWLAFLLHVWWSQVQVLAWVLAVLAERFCGFP
jgi:hypothetical protein